MKTKISAVISGVTAFLGWFITLTPEQQNSAVAPIIALIPPSAQSWIGVALKGISAVTGIYAVFRLRNNQPPTPPKE